ncbi:MAG: NUDIX domain-containing protein [Candidatus Nealsonbacteria bacterium]|nr:NUDIX domain-containing protein [Candidatus Nealsonbacteria bacterium]
MRLPYQILIFPFIKEGNDYYYAIFKRQDLNIWQGIAGGGEGDEKPDEAAKREGYEEAGIDKNSRYIRLSSIATIPAANIRGLQWGENIVAVPEFAYGVELSSKELRISGEHTEYSWLKCEDAIKQLRYDSNKSAIWELDHRLRTNTLDGIEENNQSIKKFL